jgi:peptidylprolyl isomerase
MAHPAPHHVHRQEPRCPVPAPAYSEKIPALPAGLGCPKVGFALTWIDTKIGSGALAVPGMWYTVRYTGYLPNGTKFDSTDDRPGAPPYTFLQGSKHVIPAWNWAFTGMRVGGKRRIFVPYQLAYGETGRPPAIPPEANLIFDVELVSQSPEPPDLGLLVPRPSPPHSGTEPPPGSVPH